MQATDVNPNSATYNQKQWEDGGPSSQCPANTYYNASQSVAFTRNNCTGGLVGTSVTYTVPPGKYSSTVSQAAADQQATNDENTNGQNYANTNGSCVAMENVTYNDSRTFQYSVRFTNNSTNAIYNFTANANSSGTLGQVPSGVYTVYICPINNYTPNNNYTVKGITQTSVVCATFNNVSVTSTVALSFY
jgi:ferredoxin-like protein FixX